MPVERRPTKMPIYGFSAVMEKRVGVRLQRGWAHCYASFWRDIAEQSHSHDDDLLCHIGCANGGMVDRWLLVLYTIEGRCRREGTRDQVICEWDCLG